MGILVDGTFSSVSKFLLLKIKSLQFLFLKPLFTALQIFRFSYLSSITELKTLPFEGPKGWILESIPRFPFSQRFVHFGMSVEMLMIPGRCLKYPATGVD